MDTNMAIGAKVKALRTEKKMTLKQLSGDFPPSRWIPWRSFPKFWILPCPSCLKNTPAAVPPIL